jgi:hypothetical protein
VEGPLSADLKTEKNIIGKGKAGPGRPKGLRNKATRDIKELAQPYGPECIERIAKLMKPKDPGICLAACKEMLDRGYGKSPKAVDVNSSGNVYVAVANYSGELMSQPLLAPYRTIEARATNGSGHGHNGTRPNGSSDPAAE